MIGVYRMGHTMPQVKEHKFYSNQNHSLSNLIILLDHVNLIEVQKSRILDFNNPKKINFSIMSENYILKLQLKLKII